MAEKRFYWLKLKRDFFKRHDIRIIESVPNGKDYVLFYLKLLLESIDHEGNLRFSDTLPYSADMLATITDTNIDIVRAAMKVLTEFGMVEILEDKTIYMTEVQKLIGSAVDNDNANRQRRFRERLKEATVTPALPDRYASVTKNNESKSKSKSIEIDIERDIEGESEREKSKRFTAPTVTEVQEYIIEKGYSMNAEAFVDFYTSKGWKVGSQPMKDWKAAVRNWNRRDREDKRPSFNNFPQHEYNMDDLTKKAKRRV